MSDRFEDEPRPRMPTEGVRILGAEEAQAALDSRAARPASREPGRDADDELEPILDLTPPEPAEPRIEHRSRRRRHRCRRCRCARTASTTTARAGRRRARPPKTRPRRRVDRRPIPSASDPPSGELPLPHWTEPPTGAVPGDLHRRRRAPTTEADVWDSPGSSPRFRAEGSDWAEADFGGEDLTDNTMNVGALAEASVVDDDETFERDIAERRRRTPRGRAARTMVTAPAAARGRPAASPARPTTDADADAAPRPRAAGRGPQPRPPDRDRDRGRGRGRRPDLLHARHLLDRPARVGDRRASGRSSSPPVCRRAGSVPPSALAMTGAFFLPLAARTFGTNAYPVFFGLIVVFSMLWFLWEITPGRPLLGVAMTVFSFAYVGGLGGFAGLLLASNDGIGLILGVALCVITYDVVGFFVGSQFGKSPIAPKVSPNKSFEGTLAGMIGSVLMGWLLVGGAIFGGIAPWSPGKGAVLGLFVAAGRLPRRPVRVDAQAGPRHQGLRVAPARATAGSSTASTPCCSACRSRSSWRSISTSCEEAQVRAEPRRDDPLAWVPWPPASSSSGRPGPSGPRRSTSCAATATTSASSALAAGRNVDLLEQQRAEFGVAPELAAFGPRRPRRARRARRAPRCRRRPQRGRRLRGPARDARHAGSRQAPRARQQGEPHRRGPDRRQGAGDRRRRDRARRLRALRDLAVVARRARWVRSPASC